MGAAISAARDQIKAADAEAEKHQKEQLEFLVVAATAKLDKYQATLEAGFSDPNSIQKKQVPGIRALRWVREYTVSVSDQPAEAIGAAVDSFFGKKDGTKDPELSAAQSGFKSVVGAGLNTILGNTQAGEHEEEKFFVFMQHNSLVRIDIRVWRYNFDGQGIASTHKSVFCYIFCLSVVDHTVLRPDEFTFLLSEYAGDDTGKVEAYLDKLIKLWQKMSFVPSVGAPVPRAFISPTMAPITVAA